jgi:formylglycine-generating enzyme required for sulfatase activity
MSGNVWEWVWDWKAEYPTGTVSSPNVDPLGAPWSSGLVSRGGGWYSVARDCRAGERGFSEPGSHLNYLGARLARTLVP